MKNSYRHQCKRIVMALVCCAPVAPVADAAEADRGAKTDAPTGADADKVHYHIVAGGCNRTLHWHKAYSSLGDALAGEETAKLSHKVVMVFASNTPERSLRGTLRETKVRRDYVMKRVYKKIDGEWKFAFESPRLSVQQSFFKQDAEIRVLDYEVYGTGASQPLVHEIKQPSSNYQFRVSANGAAGEPIAQSTFPDLSSAITATASQSSKREAAKLSSTITSQERMGHGGKRQLHVYHYVSRDNTWHRISGNCRVPISNGEVRTQVLRTVEHTILPVDAREG